MTFAKLMTATATAALLTGAASAQTVAAGGEIDTTDAQVSDRSVVFSNVVAQNDGFLVIRQSPSDGAAASDPASVAYAPVTAGENADVTVEGEFSADTDYVATLYDDSNASGEFEWGEDVNLSDQPSLNDGQPVETSFRVIENSGQMSVEALDETMTSAQMRNESADEQADARDLVQPDVTDELANGTADVGGTSPATGVEQQADIGTAEDALPTDGDETDTTDMASDNPTEAQSDGTTPMIAASDDFEATGDSATFPRVVATEDGYLAIHPVSPQGISPESVGYAPVTSGENTDVEVSLDTPFTAGAPYVAILHTETNDNDTLDFSMTDLEVDAPVMLDGVPVGVIFQAS